MLARRNGARLAMGLTAVLMVTACGDDKQSASQSTTTVAPTTSTTLSQTQLDKQKAQRVVLTVADLTGFTADAPDPSDNDPELDTAISACVNNNPLVTRLGDDVDDRGAFSPDFSNDDTTVGSSVTFAETEDQARTAIADLSATSVAGCFTKAFTAAFKKTPGVSNVTATTAKLPAITVGDQSVGYRTTLKFRAQSQNVTVYSDLTFIRSGRGLAEVDTNSSPAVFPAAERTRLATTLAGRMAAP
jgi:hypothetical protein